MCTVSTSERNKGAWRETLQVEVKQKINKNLYDFEIRIYNPPTRDLALVQVLCSGCFDEHFTITNV